MLEQGKPQPEAAETVPPPAKPAPADSQAPDEPQGPDEPQASADAEVAADSEVPADPGAAVENHDAQSISAQGLSDAFARMLSDDEGTQQPSDLSRSDEGHDPPASDADADDDAPASRDEVICPVSPRSVLEAILFVGHPNNEPLSRQQASSVIHGVEPEEVDALVDELNQQYAADGDCFTILSEATGYRLALREQFDRVRRRFYGRVRQARLSQAAVEVLALIAYNQPMTTEDVTKLRGHPSGAILTQLVRRQLLRRERPEEKPRTPRYFTTERFLELFGLENLGDLPRSQDVEA